MAVCEKRETECVCKREGRHRIHRCECGGSWVYGPDGEMQPRTFPGGFRDPFSALDYYLSPFSGLFR